MNGDDDDDDDCHDHDDSYDDVAPMDDGPKIPVNCRGRISDFVVSSLGNVMSSMGCQDREGWVPNHAGPDRVFIVAVPL